MTKIAWFKDVVTFWQIWENLPLSNMEKYFYDKDSN
jgi:hypothetical protein